MCKSKHTKLFFFSVTFPCPSPSPPPSLPHLGVEEDLDEIATCHDELGHQVHVVVAVAPQSRGRLTGAFRTKFGIEVREVKGSTVPSVVGVSIDVEDLEAHHREEARDDAFLWREEEGEGVRRGERKEKRESGCLAFPCS